jgi:prepilin-type N-terminal cleavage/methylation domain-containing protein
MKLNKNIRKSPQGVTLIELSVVIAVILVLISVLFIGASYYRDSANDAACQISQSSIQKGVDSYFNISGGQLSYADLETTGPFTSGAPACPTDSTISIDWSSGSAVVSCEAH